MLAKTSVLRYNYVQYSIVKRPGTSVPSRYKKKIKSHGTMFFQVPVVRVPGQPGSWCVRLYDFCDAENTGGISESSHKNGI